MIFSIEKNGAEVDEEAGGEEDEQVDGDIGAEEDEDEGDDEDVDGKIRGRFEVRSRGLGLPCLQGRLRKRVSTTASP